MKRVIHSITAVLIAGPLLLCLSGCGGGATLGASASGSTTKTGGGSGGSGGGGTSGTQSVSLSWSPSTSTVAGYLVFRSRTTGGPYTALTASPITATTYTDSSVHANTTYYYVTAAVTTAGVQSAYSNQATAAVQ